MYGKHTLKSVSVLFLKSVELITNEQPAHSTQKPPLLGIQQFNQIGFGFQRNEDVTS